MIFFLSAFAFQLEIKDAENICFKSIMPWSSSLHTKMHSGCLCYLKILFDFGENTKFP